MLLMKMGVRLLSVVAPELKELTGDLRELLCLPREEEDISGAIQWLATSCRPLYTYLLFYVYIYLPSYYVYNPIYVYR